MAIYSPLWEINQDLKAFPPPTPPLLSGRYTYSRSVSGTLWAQAANWQTGSPFIQTTYERRLCSKGKPTERARGAEWFLGGAQRLLSGGLAGWNPAGEAFSGSNMQPGRKPHLFIFCLQWKYKNTDTVGPSSLSSLWFWHENPHLMNPLWDSNLWVFIFMPFSVFSQHFFPIKGMHFFPTLSVHC